MPSFPQQQVGLEVLFVGPTSATHAEIPLWTSNGRRRLLFLLICVEDIAQHAAEPPPSVT